MYRHDILDMHVYLKLNALANGYILYMFQPAFFYTCVTRLHVLSIYTWLTCPHHNHIYRTRLGRSCIHTFSEKSDVVRCIGSLA